MLQLGVHDTVADKGTDIEEIKLACKSMKKEIVQKSLPVKIPPMCTETRWSSMYRMVDVMRQVKAPLLSHLSADLWGLVDELFLGLAPVNELTTRLQAVQYTLADLHYDLIICESELEDNIENPFVALLLSKLRARKKMLFSADNLPALAAIYLDPRVNNRFKDHFTREEKKLVVEYCMQIHQRIQSLKENDVPMTVTEMQNGSAPTADKRHERFERVCADVLPGAAVKTGAKKDLALRLQQLILQEKPTYPFNIAGHWKTVLQTDPEMAELANVILAAPATQVSVERAFSVLTLILSKTRTCLKDKNLQNLIFAKLNVPY